MRRDIVNGRDRAGQKIEEIFARCLYPPACLGEKNSALKGVYFEDVEGGEGQDLALKGIPGELSNNDTCAEGYKSGSRLCQMCESKYMRASGSRCLPCKTSSALPLLTVGIFIMIAGFIALVVLKLRSFGRSSGHRAHRRVTFDPARRSTTTHSTLKRILLTHVQTIALVLGLTVPWPTLMLHALSVLSAISNFSDNSNGVQCLNNDGETDQAGFYYAVLVLSSLLPIGALGVLAAYWFGILPRCGGGETGSCRGNRLTCGVAVTQNPAQTPAHLFVPSTTDMFISSSVLMWFLLLPSLVRIGFGVFGCTIIGEPAAVEPGKPGKPEYFLVDMEEECSGERRSLFAALVGAPMLLMYAAIVPLAIILRLRRAANAARLDDPSLMLRWSLIYSGYTKEKYWWELVVLFRKYFVIFVSTFVASEQHQLQLVLGLFIVAVHLHGTNKPFGDDSASANLLHRYEMTSLVVLTFCVWCGVYFSLDSEACSRHAGWCTFLTLLVLASNIVMLVMMTGKFCTAWCARNRVAERLRDLQSKSSARIGRAGHHQDVSGAQGRRDGGHSHSTSMVDLDLSGGIELQVNVFYRSEEEGGAECGR